MQVSVEHSSSLGRKVKVTVPSTQVDKMISERAAQLMKTANLPGFRPGKVPRSVIEKRYGPDLLNEVAGELIQSSYQEALEQEGLVPATQPEVEPHNLARGQDLEYTASFDVYPEIPAMDITGERIERPVLEIGDSDIDTTIDRMRKQRMDFSVTEEPAREEDRVTMSFIGRIDGEPFEGGAADDYPLVLGSGSVLPELDAGLVGVKAGETRDITVNFPDDYAKEDLAGKASQFEVTVSEVASPVMPEVTDEFAAEFGIQEGGVAKLREEVKNNLAREGDDRVRQNVRDQVFKALLAKSEFDMPDRMVEDEITTMIEQMKQMMGAAAENAPEPDRSMYREEAERRVRLGLIMRDVIRTREISVDAGKVREHITRMAQGYEQPDQVIQYYYADPSRTAPIEAQVLEEQVVDVLLDDATVVDTPVSFSEFTNPEGQDAPA